MYSTGVGVIKFFGNWSWSRSRSHQFFGNWSQSQDVGLESESGPGLTGVAHLWSGSKGMPTSDPPLPGMNYEYTLGRKASIP